MGDWLEAIKGLSFAASTGRTIVLALALAAAIAGLLALGRRSRLMMRRSTRLLLVGATAATLLLLGAAYSELAHVKKEKKLAVALLVDASASIPDAELARAQQWLTQAYGVKGDSWTRTLVFGRKPLPASDGAGAAPTIARPEDPLGTNIARALHQAIDMFPANYTRRAVLLTDGNQTEGDLAAEAAVAAAHGVTLSAFVLGSRADRDLYVESVTAPAAARPGERVKVGAVIVSNFETPAKLNINVGGKSVFSQTVPIAVGRNVFETEAVVGAQSAGVSAEVAAEGDMHPDNNKLSAALRVEAAPRAALFSARPEADLPLAEALSTAKIDVQPINASGLPTQPGALYGFDVVVLSDVDYKAMSKAQQEALMSYVHEGGGALVIGGENTGELGKKDNNAPIKKLMPVAFKEKKKTEPNPVTLVLIIDKSASMARERKFVMAVQAANETIDALDEKSRVGVILFDDFPRWAIPLQKVGDAAHKKELMDLLRTFGVDGGTSIYPAIGEAYKVLKDDEAKTRHMILLSDGVSMTTFEQWGHLVQWLAAKKITVSTVALGKESDQEHLKKIASVGGGRFYYSDDSSQIPRIFLEEAKQITKTGVVEKKFTPELLKKGEMLEGLNLTPIPDLTGYNPADPKPTSEIYITADRGEPLLARWRYGLGRTSALLTDSGVTWAKTWRSWPQYAPLLARLVKGSMADLALRSYRIEAAADDRVAEVKVDVTDQYGNFVNDLALTLKATDPNGDEIDAPLQQTRPGGYEGRFDVADYGAYSLRVVASGGGPNRSQGVGQINLTPPPEFVATQPDLPLLKSAVAVGGGKLDPTPAEVFAEPETTFPQAKPLSKHLLYVALGSMMLALLFRRGLVGG
jgi:Mg-chelatase subunit ChlD